MPSFFVRQPNGKLAVFSTIADGFTHVNLTEKEAMRWCASKGIRGKDAEEKIRRGAEDEPVEGPHAPRCCDQKLTRWHDCLNTILHCHGTKGLAEFLNECAEAYETTVED